MIFTMPNHLPRFIVCAFFASMLAAATRVSEAGPSVPVFPGAVKLQIPGGFPMPDTCGSKTLMDVYRSGSDAPTVTRWYRAHVSGFVEVSTGENETTMMAGDGSTGFKIRSSRVDPTSIAVIRYRPALGTAWVAAVHDPKAASSTATLQRMCSRG